MADVRIQDVNENWKPDTNNDFLMTFNDGSESKTRLRDAFYAMVPDGAPTHNNLFRGQNLGAVILYSILILLQIVNTFIFPKLQYKKYLYLIKEDEIVFYHGIIFIESVVIPMVQIQDIGFSQGPIELALGIASLDISTAGSNHYIAGFKKEEVEELVNNVKERIKKLVTDKNKGE